MLKASSSTRLKFGRAHLEALSDLDVTIRSSDVSYSDRVIRGMLHLRRVRKDTISTTFREFMKGITFFHNEDQERQPIYHRDASCGPKNGNKSFRENQQAKKENALKCYLERLVYDHLITFSKAYSDPLIATPNRQNTEHEAQLSDTFQDFITRFPKTDRYWLRFDGIKMTRKHMLKPIAKRFRREHLLATILLWNVLEQKEGIKVQSHFVEATWKKVGATEFGTPDGVVYILSACHGVIF